MTKNYTSTGGFMQAVGMILLFPLLMASSTVRAQGGGGCLISPPVGVDVNSPAYLFVIITDPFCCDEGWDSLCQDAYDAFAGGQGCTVVPPAGVDVGSLAYALVVANDPFCCTDGWDEVCQDAYDSLVGVGGCVAIPPAGVDMNSAAYAQVIAADPFCCTDEWDAFCQEAYDALTGGTDCVVIPPAGVDVTSAAYAEVIANDPFCCNDAWDEFCQEAYDALTVGTDCVVIPPAGVDVTSAAYAQVIANDPFCCNDGWDDLCQDAYDMLNPSGYCAAGALATNFEKISKVVFANIDNISTSTAGYEDFTPVVAMVQAGEQYPIGVTITNGWEEDQVLVWIDLDHSGSFEPSELVFAPPMGDGPDFEGVVTIPANAPLGSTRMRIRLVDTHDGSLYANTVNLTPCGFSTFGQVEDYTVNVDFGSAVATTAAARWNVFPNPNNGDLTLVPSGIDGAVQVELFDMTARLVHSEQRTMNSGQHVQLPLAGRLVPGTYLIRLTGSEGRYEQRIIVQ
jgi:hypothetical protein